MLTGNALCSFLLTAYLRLISFTKLIFGLMCGSGSLTLCFIIEFPGPSTFVLGSMTHHPLPLSFSLQQEMNTKYYFGNCGSVYFVQKGLSYMRYQAAASRFLPASTSTVTSD